MNLARLLLKEQSDARLCELSAEGHQPAFEVLVRRHTADLRRVASRIAPGSRADDVVQEALIKAWLALQASAEVSNPRAWLMRITANAATDDHRRRYDFDELRESLEGSGSDPAAVAERRRVVRDTLAAVAALPESQRDALLQIALDGASRRDIALEMGISEGAVRQLVHRARSTLRAGFTALTPLPLLLAAFTPGTAKASVPNLVAGAMASSGGAAAGSLATKAAVGLAVVAGAGTTVDVVSERVRDGKVVAPVVEEAEAQTAGPAKSELATLSAEKPREVERTPKRARVKRRSGGERRAARVRARTESETGAAQPQRSSPISASPAPRGQERRAPAAEEAEEEDRDPVEPAEVEEPEPAEPRETPEPAEPAETEEPDDPDEP